MHFFQHATRYSDPICNLFAIQIPTELSCHFKQQSLEALLTKLTYAFDVSFGNFLPMKYTQFYSITLQFFLFNAKPIHITIADMKSKY